MTLRLQPELWKEPNSVHKSWCFTINNYTSNDEAFVNNLECQRLAVGKEVGESGTPHLQGFVVFKKGYRFSAMKKLFPTAHLQVAKSWQHAWNYCINDGNFTIQNHDSQGQRTDIENYRDAIKDSQGQRTDIENYRDAIKGGYDDRQLCDEFPHEFLRFNRTRDMRNAYITERTEMTKCLWIHGKAGSGKSTHVKQTYPGCDWLEYDGKFFSHYKNRDTVVFDGIDMNTISRTLFLKLVNHIPYKLRVMGAYQEWNPTTLIIITNDHPKYWIHYQDPAVQRRISEILEI